MKTALFTFLFAATTAFAFPSIRVPCNRVVVTDPLTLRASRPIAFYSAGQANAIPEGGDNVLTAAEAAEMGPLEEETNRHLQRDRSRSAIRSLERAFSLWERISARHEAAYVADRNDPNLYLVGSAYARYRNFLSKLPPSLHKIGLPLSHSFFRRLEELLLSTGERLAKHYGYQTQRETVTIHRDKVIALAFLAEPHTSIGKFEARVRESFPELPHQVRYIPQELITGANGALVFSPYLGVSHDFVTTLAPTPKEDHEVRHLILARALYLGIDSPFHGLSHAAGNVPLAGIEDITGVDFYGYVFSHNEGFTHWGDLIDSRDEFVPLAAHERDSTFFRAGTRVTNAALGSYGAGARLAYMGRAVSDEISHFTGFRTPVQTRPFTLDLPGHEFGDSWRFVRGNDGHFIGFAFETIAGKRILNFVAYHPSKQVHLVPILNAVITAEFERLNLDLLRGNFPSYGVTAIEHLINAAESKAQEKQRYGQQIYGSGKWTFDQIWAFGKDQSDENLRLAVERLKSLQPLAAP